MKKMNKEEKYKKLLLKNSSKITNDILTYIILNPDKVTSARTIRRDHNLYPPKFKELQNKGLIEKKENGFYDLNKDKFLEFHGKAEFEKMILDIKQHAVRHPILKEKPELMRVKKSMLKDVFDYSVGLGKAEKKRQFQDKEISE